MAAFKDSDHPLYKAAEPDTWHSGLSKPQMNLRKSGPSKYKHRSFISSEAQERNGAGCTATPEVTVTL